MLKYPTKILMTFWALLAGVNFYFFLLVPDDSKYFSGALVLFCIWRLFHHRKKGMLVKEFNKQQAQQEKITNLFGKKEE